MVREDILGGLRNALSRGESLNQAMRSFLNAGYNKEEIEEAARALESGVQQPVQQVQPQPAIQQPIQQTQKTQSMPQQPVQQPVVVQKVSAYGQTVQPVSQQPIQQTPSVPQKVSAYESPQKKPRGKAIIFILVAMLILLLGILVAVFFFKEEIISFFNT